MKIIDGQYKEEPVAGTLSKAERCSTVIMVGHLQLSHSLYSWRSALDELQMSHPFLRMRLAPDGSLIMTEATIPLRAGDPIIGWQREAASELDKPFSLEDGPLLRAVVLPNGKLPVIMLVMHQCLADALPPADIFENLLVILAGHRPRWDLTGLNAIQFTRQAGPFDTVQERLQVSSLTLTEDLTHLLHHETAVRDVSLASVLMSALLLSCKGCSCWDDGAESLQFLYPRGSDSGVHLRADPDHRTNIGLVPINRWRGDIWTLARRFDDALRSKDFLSGFVGAFTGASLYLPRGPDVTYVKLLDLWVLHTSKPVAGEHYFGAVTHGERLRLTHASTCPPPGLLERLAGRLAEELA